MSQTVQHPTNQVQSQQPSAGISPDTVNPPPQDQPSSSPTEPKPGIKKHWLFLGAFVVLAVLSFGFYFLIFHKAGEKKPVIDSQAGTISPTVVPTLDISASASADIAKYDKDSDGNIIPDFVEEALGKDPLVDDCIRDTGCERGDVGKYDGKKTNTLLILDSSGSMAKALGNETRMTAAKAVIKEWISNFPADENVGLMIYGHKGSNSDRDKAVSCQGIELLYPLASIDKEKYSQAVDSFQPTGWTPIADSLLKAKNEIFAGHEDENNRIILVSDGIEMCNGDPIAAANELKSSNVSFVVDVVGLSVDSAAQNQLRQVAEITGGQYYSADSRKEFENAMNQYLENRDVLFEENKCLQMNYNKWIICLNDLNIKSLTYLNKMLNQLRKEDKDMEVQKNRDTFDKIEAAHKKEIEEIRKVYDERYRQNLEDLEKNEEENNPL